MLHPNMSRNPTNEQSRFRAGFYTVVKGSACRRGVTIHTHIYMCIYIYICVCVCAGTGVCVCVYIYTFINKYVPSLWVLGP